MKNGLVLLLLLAATFTVHAQDAYEGARLSSFRFSGGIRLGLNLSQLNGDNWQSGYKSSLLGGVFLGVMGKRAGLQVEGNFLQSQYITGKTFYDAYSSYYKSALDSVRAGTFRVSYLSIPVLFQVRIFPKVILQFGPQYSGVVTVDDRDELLKDAEGLFRKGSVDAVGGLWFRVSRRINAGARYVLGITDLNETAVDESWKARSVQLHVGLSL